MILLLEKYFICQKIFYPLSTLIFFFRKSLKLQTKRRPFKKNSYLWMFVNRVVQAAVAEGRKLEDLDQGNSDGLIQASGADGLTRLGHVRLGPAGGKACLGPASGAAG